MPNSQIHTTSLSPRRLDFPPSAPRRLVLHALRRMVSSCVMARAVLTPREQQALAAFKARVLDGLGTHLVSVRVFGSRARGEGGVESDLDVLVIVDGKDRELYRRVIEAALDVDLEYDTEIAPTILTVAEYDRNRALATPFFRNVEHDAIPL